MSAISFCLWIIARNALTVYASQAFCDYLFTHVCLIPVTSKTFREAVKFGLFVGILYGGIPIVLGRTTGNFWGLLLSLSLEIIGTIAGSVCHWRTPLISLFENKK